MAVSAVGAANVANSERSVRPVASGHAPVWVPDEARLQEGRPGIPAVSRGFDRAGLRTNGGKVRRLAAERSRALVNLAEAADSYARRLERERWVLPMTEYRLTGRFGNIGFLWSSSHTGLDFAAPAGTEIRSITGGVVTEAGWAGAYGLRTIVELADGTEIWYCHQSSVAVSVGATVSPGEPIGAVGSTGNVTGPHLHLEVRPGGGDPVDPYEAFVEQGVRP